MDTRKEKYIVEGKLFDEAEQRRGSVRNESSFEGTEIVGMDEARGGESR